MFKVAVGSSDLARRMLALPYADKWLRIRIDNLAELRDTQIAELAYRQIGNTRGVTKQTHDARFASLDETTLSIVRSIDACSIHDVGVSSGITSLRLWESLRKSNLRAALTVSDKYARFRLVDRFRVRTVFDADDSLVCAYFGLLYCDPHTSWKYPLSRLLLQYASTLRPAGGKEIMLFHPDLLEKLASGEIHEVQFDVLGGPGSHGARYDYVRCMNLLNRSYFDEDQLASGVETLKSILNDNGVLQVGRTDTEGTNRVSFYQLRSDRLCLIDTINGGSEIHDVIAASDGYLEPPMETDL